MYRRDVVNSLCTVSVPQGEGWVVIELNLFRASYPPPTPPFQDLQYREIYQNLLHIHVPVQGTEADQNSEMCKLSRLFFAECRPAMQEVGGPNPGRVKSVSRCFIAEWREPESSLSVVPFPFFQTI
jgi:hypothetical protein